MAGLFARLGLSSRYEEMLTEILIEAVQLLSDKNDSENERSLNRKLYQKIITTCRARNERGEHVPDFPPIFDGPNPPMTPDEVPSERKRPDFRWDIMDHQLDATSVRSFAVECKRLRRPYKGWVFNVEYAVNGVRRFTAEEHRYGENMASGVMVGYWQNMGRDAVLAQTNDALDSLGLPRLDFGDGQVGPLHQAAQALIRHFEGSPYRLRHLWWDMRSDAAMAQADAAADGAAVVASGSAPDETEHSDQMAGGEG